MVMQLLLSAGACSGINDGCKSAQQFSSFWSGNWCDRAGIDNVLHVTYIDAILAADDRALSSFETTSDMQLGVQCTYHIRTAEFVCRDHSAGR